MHPFFIIGIVRLMAVVNSAPVTDGLNPDGTTPYLGDQLDSTLNFQPLPKIVTLGPVQADPESDPVTSGSITQSSPPKPVIPVANSESNPHRSNATSSELAQIKPDDSDPKRDYFQENDFKCSKKANFIGCCDDGAFDKCEIFGAQNPICKKSKNMSCCHRVLDLVSSPNPNTYECDSKAKQLSGPVLY